MSLVVGIDGTQGNTLKYKGDYGSLFKHFKSDSRKVAYMD